MCYQTFHDLQQDFLSQLASSQGVVALHFIAHPFKQVIHNHFTSRKFIHDQSPRSPTPLSSISLVNHVTRVPLPSHMYLLSPLLWSDFPNGMIDIGPGRASNLSLHTTPFLIASHTNEKFWRGLVQNDQP
ncbi:hypothetical protein AVEN_155879-1 [Araneus ventricosus]|uniref:Uncharacterized protein n=1 Tax=Araneus ventricosus TaxID=182803 RepID=A0A4Y2MVR5_ARAVE|nr:hypothetical protein AVEN_155879-1 [Araneus ventricosus]